MTFSFHHVLAWATSALDLMASQPTALRMTKLGFFPTLGAFFGEILYLATFSWNRHTLLISCALNRVSPCYWPWLYFAADLLVFCFSVEGVLVFVRGAVNSLRDLSRGVWFHPALYGWLDWDRGLIHCWLSFHKYSPENTLKTCIYKLCKGQGDWCCMTRFKADGIGSSYLLVFEW